ncbi:MAG TPA: sigma-70 family RNA polymerase sigma factor [Gemmataceae bacterium]|jgi:RNA polymerase sigma-70 factor (ECF subfamily)
MSDPSLHTVHLHDWFRRMRAGDSAASEELLRATGDRLERLARRMLRQFPNVRRLADTGDVCQEAVVRLLRSLRQLDPPPANVRDYLGLAAAHIRRELLDLARRGGTAKRHGDVPLQGVEEYCEPAATPDDPDELERWRRFHEEVEKLPVEVREVVGLRFYHGWPEAEIAELFGVTERTVRRRWASGCARLAAALGGELPCP